MCSTIFGYHHGGEPDAEGMIGHRSAHCHVDSSPLRAAGYILRTLPLPVKQKPKPKKLAA